MECNEISRFVYVYLDGEFEPRERAEFEQHVNGCTECRALVRFERSFHQLLRERMEKPSAPEALRQRVQRALDEEEARQPHTRRRPLPSWAWAPVAAAAALVAVLVWPALRGAEQGRPAALEAVSDSPLESFVDEAVAVHEEGLPAEVAGDEESVGRFVQQRVSFRAAPPFAESASTRLVGARLTRVGSRPAVVYTYEHEGKRLSVVQYAAPEAPQGPSTFRRALYTGRSRGHNVAHFRDHDRGLAHSVVGDVDEGALVRLIPASYR